MNEYEGCSDGACILRLKPLKQHTHGGCRCLRDIPTPKRMAIKRKLNSLEAEIERLTQERDEARKVAKLASDAMSMIHRYPWLED